MFLNIPAMAYIESFVQTFKEYPPRQKPEGLEVKQALEKMQQSAGDH